MHKFITRISIVLVVFIVLPLLLLMVRQAASLNENEQQIQKAYNEQLESILFSINQNSENIFMSWVNALNLPVDLNGDIMNSIVSKILTENEAIVSVHFYNLNNLKHTASFYNEKIQHSIPDLPNQAFIEKLKNYWKNNYKRIETVRSNNVITVYFLIENEDGFSLCAMVVNAKSFVNQNLRVITQQVEQDRFFVSVIDTLYTESTIINDSILSISNHALSTKLWYLPGYKAGIELRSTTIQQVVTARKNQEIYIFVGLFLLVLFGIIFVMIAIQKEVKLAEMKSEFVSNVSHEIRTPLALINMYTETLLMGRVKDEKKKEQYLNTIHQETSRLTNLVNRILSFSKMEKDVRKYMFKNEDINEIVFRVMQKFEPHFKQKNVQPNLKLTDENTLLNLDSEAISEVFINLIDNAIKYSKDEIQISIETILKKDEIWIEVKDNGIGIAPKHLSHIFDKFYRVSEGDLAHKAKGSGIGLNIVSQIMKAHKGSVTVNSTLNVGSCFTLKLPIQKKLEYDQSISG